MKFSLEVKRASRILFLTVIFLLSIMLLMSSIFMLTEI